VDNFMNSITAQMDLMNNDLKTLKIKQEAE